MQNRVTITAFQFSQFTEEGALLLFNFKRQIKSLGVPLFLISIGIFASVALPAESEPRPLFGFVIALTFLSQLVFRPSPTHSIKAICEMPL